MNIVIQKKNSKSIKNMTKLNNAINKGDDVFIFVNADWCGHCKKLAPIFEELSEKVPESVRVAKFDATLSR